MPTNYRFGRWYRPVIAVTAFLTLFQAIRKVMSTFEVTLSFYSPPKGVGDCEAVMQIPIEERSRLNSEQRHIMARCFDLASDLKEWTADWFETEVRLAQASQTPEDAEATSLFLVTSENHDEIGAKLVAVRDAFIEQLKYAREAGIPKEVLQGIVSEIVPPVYCQFLPNLR